MIRTTVKLQLTAFIVIALVGISYVSVRYVGIGDALFGGSYTVKAQFTDSGGIFTNADVTYRGVGVGRIGELRLLPNGVEVDLEIDGDAPRIPNDVVATVSNRSAVGEQYVDLAPRSAGGPYLADGSVISMDNTAIPISTDTLLLDLDTLLQSVDQEKLAIVIDELGKGFAGTGNDLQRLLDASNALLTDATTYLPQTTQLIDDAKTVLDTQVASGSAIQTWAENLQLLTAQLRASDADLRALLANAPQAATELDDFVTTTGGSLANLIDNLNVLVQIAGQRLPGLEQLLITYPGVVAGSFTVLPGDDTAHFGFVLLKPDMPPPCTAGYEGTDVRYPQDQTEVPPNTDAYCAEPPGSPTDVRGAQNVPPAGGAAPSPTYVPPGDASAGGSTGGQPTEPLPDSPFPPGIGD